MGSVCPMENLERKQLAYARSGRPQESNSPEPRRRKSIPSETEQVDADSNTPEQNLPRFPYRSDYSLTT